MKYYNSFIITTALLSSLLFLLYFREYTNTYDVTEGFVPTTMYRPLVRKTRLMCDKYSKEYPIVEKFIGRIFK